MHLYPRTFEIFTSTLKPVLIKKKNKMQRREASAHTSERGSRSQMTHVEEGIKCGNESSDTEVVNTGEIIYDKIISESVSSSNSIRVIYSICQLDFSYSDQLGHSPSGCL